MDSRLAIATLPLFCLLLCNQVGNAKPACHKSHTVTRNDTCERIGTLHMIPVDALRRINPHVDCSRTLEVESSLCVKASSDAPQEESVDATTTMPSERGVFGRLASFVKTGSDEDQLVGGPFSDTFAQSEE